jgi:hypothetical protein
VGRDRRGTRAGARPLTARRLGLPLVSALAVLATGCGGHSSGGLYDARATRDCLQDRPEYAGTLPADAGTVPTRTVLYVSDIHRYPKALRDRKFRLDVAEGTERVDLFFDGPADETLSQTQTPSLFFYPDASTARRTYRAQIARSDSNLPSEQRVSLRKTFGLARNAVILWAAPNVPQRLRAIVRGCLRP